MSTLALTVMMLAMCALCMYAGYVIGQNVLPAVRDLKKLPDGTYTPLGAVNLRDGDATTATYLVVLRQHGTNTRSLIRTREVLTEPFQVADGIVTHAVVAGAHLKRVDKLA